MQSKQPSAAFSALVTVLLFAEIFAPFAFAQPPDYPAQQAIYDAAPLQASGSPAPFCSSCALSTLSLQGADVFGCQIKEITSAQYRQLMDSVFMFEAKEITDRPDQSLKSTPAGTPQSINVNVYNYPAEEAATFMTANEFASLAASGKTNKDDVLKALNDEFGVGPNDQISVSQARTFSTKKGYSNSLQAQLSALASKNKNTGVAPSFEAMKVRLPNGNEVALSDMLKVPQIQTNFRTEKSCLLQNAQYTGRISYRGLLDKDLTIAVDRAEADRKPFDQSVQHLNTKSIQGSFSNYEGSLVVPRLYELALKELKLWNYVDFLVTSGTAIFAMNSVHGADDAAKAAKEAVGQGQEGFSLSKVFPPVMFEGRMVSTVPLGLREGWVTEDAIKLKDAFQAAVVTSKASGTTRLMNVPNDIDGLKSLAPTVLEDFQRLSTNEQRLSWLAAKADFTKKMPTGAPSGTFAPGYTEAVLDETRTVVAPDKITTLANNLRKAGGMAYSRAWSSVTLGLLWMGPARFGLELAGQMVFTSAGAPDSTKGTRVVVFANNRQFLEAFRSGSDWLMSGHVLELISDVTKSGIPAKIFNVDKLQFIRTMGNTGPETTSHTTILPEAGGGWFVSEAWKARSEFAAFEDVRDGKQTTSMALEVNNTKISVGFNRRKEFAAYYGQIAVFAPVFGWFFHRVPTVSNTLITLVRLSILDYWIDNFIDPAGFSDKQLCVDENMYYYVNWYKAWIAASTAEQLLLFTSIGGRLKTEMETWGAMAQNMVRGGEIYSKIALIDPISIGKAYVGGKALEYASTCQDTQYKIAVYQNLPKVTQGTLQKLRDKAANTMGVGDIAQAMNIGKNLEATVGSQLKSADLTEILNFKAILSGGTSNEGTTGSVRPSEVYEVHVDPETVMQRTDPYGEGCFRNCLVNKAGQFICVDGERGVYDSKGRQILDKDFALNSYTIPRLGTVVPTKLIIAPLSCGSGPFIALAAAGASATIVDVACGAGNCILEKLQTITGARAGSVLSNENWLGPLKAMQTTMGVAEVYGSEFRLTYTNGVMTTRSGALASAASGLVGGAADVVTNVVGGTIETIPTGPTQVVGQGLQDAGSTVATSLTDKTAVISDVQDKAGTASKGLIYRDTPLRGTEKRFSEAELLGDGRVRVKGSTKVEDQLGELATLEFANGAIHFDRAQRRIIVAIRTFSDIPASSIQTIGATPDKVSGGRTELQDELRKLQELRDKLASGQALTQAQLDLLRKLVEQAQFKSQDSFTPAEQAKLRDALAKRSTGKPLTSDEAKLVDRAAQMPFFPGFIPLPGERITTVKEVLNNAGTPADKTAAVAQKLENNRPLTLDEKKTVSDAIDKAVSSGKISATDAAALKKSVSDATSPTERAREVVEAVQQGKALPADQKQAILNTIATESTRVQSDIATAPLVDLPGIKLGPVIAKPGQEQNAANMNRALEKIGVLTDFKTDKSVYSFGSDAAGNAVLKIGNKDTGQVKEYKITGEVTRDGNSIVVPTDKGPMKFDFSMNPTTGAPTINVTGPDINESGPLLLAQGKDGFMWFDPVTGTWKTGPGVVIPTDELFGKTGAQFQGSADGTRGIAQQDPYTPAQAYNNLANGPSSSPLLSLPSWPDNLAGIILMLLAILGGALITRVLKRQ